MGQDTPQELPSRSRPFLRRLSTLSTAFRKSVLSHVRAGGPAGLVGLAGLATILLGSVTPQGTLPETPDPSNKVALVIGISNYVAAEPLRYAASDAESFAAFLQSPRGGNFSPDQVILLLEDDASRFRIFSELELLQDRITPNHTVYIFLAGHGIVNRRGIGYFVPSDGDLDLLAPTCVPFSALKELVELGLGQVRHRILMTDLCHAGRIGPEKSELATQIQNLINQELLHLAPGKGSFLNLLGSRPTEPSWERDDLQGGVFSHVLLQALNGEAAEPDADVVTADAVVEYVRAEVPRYTANQQHPMANEDYARDLVLSFPPLPGPQEPESPAEAILILTNLDLSSFHRLEWTDPRTGSRVLRRLEHDSAEVAIDGLRPGILNLTLFREADGTEAFSQAVVLELTQGENLLDLSTLATGRPPRPQSAVPMLASLSPLPLLPPVQGPVGRVTGAGQATLLLKAAGGTRIFVDQSYFGQAPEEGYVQIGGLEPGDHLIYLTPSPEREYRYRVSLFSGPQSLEWQTGQLQPLARQPVLPQLLELPSDLPSTSATDFRAFRRSLWEGRLLGGGDTALSAFSRMESSLPSNLSSRLRHELAVRMGDQAQRIILRYVRGGDIRWTPEIFEEGAELVRHFREMVRSTPNLESQEHFFRGRAFIEREQFTEAETELNLSISLDAEASHAYNALGLALWRQNRLDQAIDPLLRAMELSPRWTYPRNTLALIRLELRQYEQAEELLLGSLELDPNDSAAAHGLGQIDSLFGRWEEAEDWYRRAIEAHPGNAYAHHSLALLLARTLRLEEAEEILRLAIRLEPEEPAFRISLAAVLRQSGRIAAADALFDTLPDVESDPDLLMARTEHFFATGRETDGSRLLERVIELQSDNPEIRVRAGLLWQQRDPERSREEFRRAVRLDPENPYAHYNLALSEVADRNLDRAMEHLRRSAEADPRYPQPHYLRGRIERARGEAARAEDSLRLALDLAVEPALRQQIREELESLESEVAAAAISEADSLASRGRVEEAWRKLAEAENARPGRPDIRNRILALAEEHPQTVRVDDLTEGTTRRALSTRFWQARRLASQLWETGRTEAALARVTQAFDQIEEDPVLLTTEFNLGNAEFSIHEQLLQWIERANRIGAYQTALDLFGLADQARIFGEVPDYSPPSIDRLMRPSQEATPESFSEFDVALHPDFQAHRLLAVALAGTGRLPEATRLLEALESAGRDYTTRLQMAQALAGHEGGRTEAITFLQEGLDEAAVPDQGGEQLEVLWLLAELHLLEGNRDGAVETLREGLRLVPDESRFRGRLRELGVDP